MAIEKYKLLLLFAPFCLPPLTGRCYVKCCAGQVRFRRSSIKIYRRAGTAARVEGRLRDAHLSAVLPKTWKRAAGPSHFSPEIINNTAEKGAQFSGLRLIGLDHRHISKMCPYIQIPDRKILEIRILHIPVREVAHNNFFPAYREKSGNGQPHI